MIRPILIDDHRSYRIPLAALLSGQEDIEVTGQAGSVAEALDLVREVTFSAALLDLSLPDGNGLDLVPAISQSNPDAAIIVLTGVTHAASRALAIAAGAVGYIEKTADVDEIIAALRLVHQGHPLMPPVEAMRLVRQAAEYQNRSEASDAAIALLSARELDVLRGIAAGLDNQAIATQLNLGLNTVRTHVAHVLSKLGVHSRLQAALLAVHHGIVDQHSSQVDRLRRL